MERQNLYFFALGALLFLSAVALSALAVDDLGVYFSVFTIDYFATSAVFAPRRRTHDLLGLALFVVFAYVVAVRVLAILGA
ncbi:MAG: hypothetical protein JRN39_07520 [Nitrososphaerota archaeon]|nr:hypothetical protein [Nitrososphaerota archaeon]